ncbi:hypothetical protein M433DRAFT_358504 [Acidomyces richmondensis BFW]|nr:MAG: hypothetical protein FE78DRAFT_494322 [Acidomyces sp. 'richmondensis']KYG43405.1 hypothetical protein M433DRAFT_358504 [Acidomyces richmondensis BFW]
MSASATSTALPSGYHAPLAVVNANNHGGWIVICNAFGLVVGLICLAIRVYIRTKVSPPFALDDWILAAATGLSTIQASILFSAVSYGYGKTLKLIQGSHLVLMQERKYAAEILFIIALYLIKCSVVLLYNRIAPDRQHSIAGWAVLGISIIFGICSVFLVALRCDLSQPWIQYGKQCDSLYAQWVAIATFDIISEVALFGLSINLVWGLQTSISRKMRVVSAFSFRLPIIVIAVIRVHYVDNVLSSSNPTLVGAVAGVLMQLELYYSLMSATIPCLRPFLANFSTNYGAMGGETVIGGSQIGTTKRDPKGSKGSFVLSSVSNHELSTRGKEKTISDSDGSMNEQIFRPDRGQTNARCTHNSQAVDASSIGSNESQKMIIKKQVEYSVESDGSRVGSKMW